MSTNNTISYVKRDDDSRMRFGTLDIETGEVTEITNMKQLIGIINNDIAASGKYSFEKLACRVCSKPSGGGRFTCCAKPVCYTCFDKEVVLKKELFPKCNHCDGDRGYVRLDEKQ